MKQISDVTTNSNTLYQIKKIDQQSLTEQTSSIFLDKILVFIKGNGTYSNSTESLKIQNKTIHFVPANSKIDFVFTAQTKGYCILYQSESMMDCLSNADVENKVVLADSKNFGQVLNLMETLLKSNSQIDFQQKIVEFLTLIKTFEPYYGIEKSSCTQVQSSYLDRFYAMIQKIESIKISIKNIARELTISLKYLEELCQKKFGKSPLSMIRALIIKKAQKMLVETDKPIYTIAEKLGFVDTSHFSKTFKKETGLCPSYYR
jgi:AraC-like DNA-binding protein